MQWLEEAARGWNADPSPSSGPDTVIFRRHRAYLRRHPLGSLVLAAHVLSADVLSLSPTPDPLPSDHEFDMASGHGILPCSAAASTTAGRSALACHGDFFLVLVVVPEFGWEIVPVFVAL
jgi:hypothetical protein